MAEEARSRGHADAAQLYLRAADAARAEGRTDLVASAAMQLLGSHPFGTAAGRVPELLHEAYRAAPAGPVRGRLAAALARLWVYSAEAPRAVELAAEAMREAEAAGSWDDRADALEAALLVRWGPEYLKERAELAEQLEETAAYSSDVGLRLRSCIWSLGSALECLDQLGVRRHLRDLDLLAEQSGSDRARFYALSRGAMAALLEGNAAEAEVLCVAAAELGARIGEADTTAVQHSLLGEIARQRADTLLLRREAALYEAYAAAEGVPSVLAQAALLRLETGESGEAAEMARRVAGEDFSRIPRDVDWILTACLVTEVAARTGDRELAATMHGLLAPFAGRGVLNAGAVTFHGVVDDYLYLAASAEGLAGEAEEFRRRSDEAYRRLGAPWWRSRLSLLPAPGSRPPSGRGGLPAEPAAAMVLLPAAKGIWLVGPHEAPVALPAMKGLAYLRQLVRNPGQEIPCRALAGSVMLPAAEGFGDPGAEVLDAAARAAYKQRLADLAAEIDEAAAWNDPERAAMLSEERDQLVHALAAAYGLGGRPRRLGSEPEKARVAVRKAIAAALARIEQADPVTGRLLRSGVRTGSRCRYDQDPGRPVRWQTEAATTVGM